MTAVNRKSALIERRYKETPKAHSTFGRTGNRRRAWRRRADLFVSLRRRRKRKCSGRSRTSWGICRGNILIERHSLAETARFRSTCVPPAGQRASRPLTTKDEEAIRGLLAQSRQKLFSIRNQRARPHLDDKIIAAWNRLMISAFARGAQVLNDASYLETATRAANFIRTISTMNRGRFVPQLSRRPRRS